MVIIFTQCDCTYHSFLNFVYSLAMVSPSHQAIILCVAVRVYYITTV